MDPYEVLGVPRDATSEEARLAYRTLAQIFHPDRYADQPEAVKTTAEGRMKELTEAYRVVVESRTRAAASGQDNEAAPDPHAWWRESGQRSEGPRAYQDYVRPDDRQRWQQMISDGSVGRSTHELLTMEWTVGKKGKPKSVSFAEVSRVPAWQAPRSGLYQVGLDGGGTRWVRMDTWIDADGFVWAPQVPGTNGDRHGDDGGGLGAIFIWNLKGVLVAQRSPGASRHQFSVAVDVGRSLEYEVHRRHLLAGMNITAGTIVARDHTDFMYDVRPRYDLPHSVRSLLSDDETRHE